MESKLKELRDKIQRELGDMKPYNFESPPDREKYLDEIRLFCLENGFRVEVHQFEEGKINMTLIPITETITLNFNPEKEKSDAEVS